MANTDDDQEALPGIPAPPKRKIIKALEEKCLERDTLSGKRTALSDEIAEVGDEIQKLLVKHEIPSYTYKDKAGVLQDVLQENKLKKVKSKLNPKKSKKGE